MGKGITALAIATFFTAHAYASQPLFDYKQLDGDSAEYAFINRFSDSRVFDCYKNGKRIFQLGVGTPFKGLRSGEAAEAQFSQKHHAPFNWNESSSYIGIEMWLETKKGAEFKYISAGNPLFDSNDSLKYMAVDLLDGKKVEFTRFGPIPDFPFNTRKKLKPFFYYQVEGEPRYECGAIDQPN